MDRVKKLKIQLSAAIFLFFCMIIFGGFFSPDFKNFALALSPNYSKTLPGAMLNLTEWNNLDDDFVAKSGSTMTGALNMGNQRITNLVTPTVGSSLTDAANKAYVDGQILALVGSGAGSTFVDWGVSSCPTGYSFLYSGLGFGADSADIGGSNNPVCIDSSGDYGAGYVELHADNMYPLVTGSTSIPPASEGIETGKPVECAVCRKAGTCYESFGNWGCATGFSSAYNGYLLGAKSTLSIVGNSGERLCVDVKFNTSRTVTSTTANSTILVGSRIEADNGTGYTNFTFIKCSVCCSN